MKVLIVDDEQIRHDTIKKFHVSDEVVSAYNYEDVLRLVAKYDLVYLDHDLGSRTEPDGEAVAKYIVSLDVSLHPDVVIVHSMNSVGAVEITNVFKYDAPHIKCYRETFSSILSRAYPLG